MNLLRVEPYRPEYFAEVAAFAGNQPEFAYLRAIIRTSRDPALQPETHCYVWREKGHVVAICGLAYLNRRDAWLFGMRVDDRCKGAGVATRLTRELVRIAADRGRTWIALDTMDHPRKAPVFRICEKLGMKLHGIFATAVFRNLPPAGGASYRVRPYKIITRHWRQLGTPFVFRERFPLWTWSRLGSESARELNAAGCLVAGTPAHVAQAVTKTAVNLYDQPDDFHSFLEPLLGFARGRGHQLVINFPAEWQPELLSAARKLLPGLRRGRRFDLVGWRIYGMCLDAQLTSSSELDSLV